MKIDQKKLINDLVESTKEVLNNAIQLQTQKEDTLNWKASAESWSVLECIEHLNRYGEFYLPEIKNRMSTAKNGARDTVFKSGMLGNYFAKGMLPKEELNKMKTFKSMNPAGSDLNKSTLDTFIEQQKEMLNLLDKARTIDLNKTKTSISISSLIKLKLGDTFRVVIYHNERHIVQAKKVIASWAQTSKVAS